MPPDAAWGRDAGQPCWVDLVVPDVASAAQFYESTLGWTLTADGDARAALVDGHRVAGLVPIGRVSGAAETRRNPSLEASWIVWFTTGDVDAASRRTEALGGSIVMAPRRLPRGAQAALARDPFGASFGLWQPDPDPGFGTAHRPGAYDWCDLFSPDGRAAQRFFADLFDARLRPLGTAADETVAGSPDAFLIVREAPVAALFERRDEPARWLVFFEVDDADAVAAACERGGGRVAEPPSDTPYGRLALLVDPFGAPFGINRVRQRA